MNRLSAMLVSARPWSFILSAASITAGTVIALQRGAFNLWRYLLILVAAIIAHAGINLLNDYFDFSHGVDDPTVATSRYRPHPLVEGRMTPRQILGAAIACYVVSIGMGVIAAAIVGWSLLIALAVGVLISVFYTAEPLNFKRRALGELVMAVATGPFMVGGAYFVQTESWEGIWAVVLISIPVGTWWSLILSANNLKDIDTDRKTLGHTVATRLGKRGAVAFFVALTAVVYGFTLIDILVGLIPVWGIAVFVTLPRMIQLARTFSRAEEVPANADPMTAQLEMIYSVIFVAAFILNRFVPLSIGA